MTDNTAPNFLDRLQAAEREQGLIQLRTLLAKHRHNLARLPRLAAELQTLLDSTETLDQAALADNLQTVLAQANEFLLAIDLAPVDYPDQPELVALGEKLLPLVSSNTVAALSARFAQARDGAAQAAQAARQAQAQAEKAAQQAQAQAAAERARQAAAQQAIADRRAAALALGFVDHGNGTVTDTHHKLMWKQCAEGQSGLACEGNPADFSWDVAMQIPKTLNLRGGFAGYKDWRVPSIDELASLIMHGRTYPAICTEAFPNAPSTKFWSSSFTDGSNKFACFFYFSDGRMGGRELNDHFAVRLVRSSQ